MDKETLQNGVDDARLRYRLGADGEGLRLFFVNEDYWCVEYKNKRYKPQKKDYLFENFLDEVVAGKAKNVDEVAEKEKEKVRKKEEAAKAEELTPSEPSEEPIIVEELPPEEPTPDLPVEQQTAEEVLVNGEQSEEISGTEEVKTEEVKAPPELPVIRKRGRPRIKKPV